RHNRAARMVLVLSGSESYEGESYGQFHRKRLRAERIAEQAAIPGNATETCHAGQAGCAAGRWFIQFAGQDQEGRETDLERKAPGKDRPVRCVAGRCKGQAEGNLQTSQ